MLMKPLPGGHSEDEDLPSAPTPVQEEQPHALQPQLPAHSTGAAAAHLAAGVLGLGAGAFLGLIFALLSGLLTVC